MHKSITLFGKFSGFDADIALTDENGGTILSHANAPGWAMASHPPNYTRKTNLRFELYTELRTPTITLTGMNDRSLKMMTNDKREEFFVI